jgi:hypothetical protein
MWGPLAAVALLWPARLRSPLDGVPLDQPLEAVLIGVVFTTLWWFHSRFLRTRLARATIVGLLAWNAVTAMTLAQDGWCVQFNPSTPFVKDATGAVHSWDLRADWLSASPTCSAIVRRPYHELAEFPAWFFNLPPPNDSWPNPKERPPGATVGMTVDGFIVAPSGGRLDIVTGPEAAASLSVDGQAVSGGGERGPFAVLSAGVHHVAVRASLTGDRWQFAPLWNGRDLWSRGIATVTRPSGIDRVVRPWAGWVTAAVVIAWGLAWLLSAIARVGDADVLAWSLGSSVCVGLLATIDNGDLGRWSIGALIAAALIRTRPRSRNTIGAMALVGVPWLALVVVLGAPAIGRFTLYESGHDYWMYQRFAYRIVMQGYWLEGGSATFWFQPFYRWIVGALHAIFGDSSVGEIYWDGACILVMALFSYHVTKRFAGFPWGVAAAALTLTVFSVGTTGTWIGRGLSEISSAGFVYLAALYALRSRHGHWTAAAAAGSLATLAFYTRLNNLPAAAAVIAFAWPVRQPVRTWWRPSTWSARFSVRTAVVAGGILCLGVLLFALRTWHYTGVFSVLYGTQGSSLALYQPGMPFSTMLDRAVDSVLMVLTMNEPPRFDPVAVPVMLGAVTAVLAALGVPRFRDLPLPLVCFCLAALSGALVARGTGYTGRFSAHVIAVTCSLTMCAASLLHRERVTRRGRGTDAAGAARDSPFE